MHVIDKNEDAVSLDAIESLEKGVVKHNGALYFTAARIAEFDFFEGLGSRAGVFKRAKKDKWPSIKVPYQGRQDGAEHFLVPSDKAALYEKRANSPKDKALTPAETKDLNQALLELCFNAYNNKYKGFESAHLTLQLKFVTSLYNSLGALFLSKEDYTKLDESDISKLLDIMIKLGKAEEFTQS